MGSISSRTCQTCKYNINNAGVLAGKINCDDCSRAIRHARPRPQQSYQCGYCKKINQLDYEAKIEGFYLCDGCSGRVQSYLDKKKFVDLEFMIDVIKGNGYTVPQSYYDALEKAKKAVRDISCQHCGEQITVPYTFEVRSVFRCRECAKMWREASSRMMANSNMPGTTRSLMSSFDLPD